MLKRKWTACSVWAACKTQLFVQRRFADCHKLIIDILACIIGIVVYAFIIKASYKGFINAINIGEAEIAGSVRISTVPGRFCIIFGSSMMILEMINKTVKYMYSLITQKDFDQGGMADEGGNLG